MSLYIGREASKLWKRLCTETSTELKLLGENWKHVLGGLIFQIYGLEIMVSLSFATSHEFSNFVERAWSLNVFLISILWHAIAICWTFRSSEYIHGLAARGVHYIHRPGPTLQDAGFFFLPELGLENAYMSETVFTFIFLSFVLWTLHPFVLKSKKIYTVLIWCRVLAFLCACQFLRIITFYSTQLPGPNYHCREGSKLARLPRPDNVLEVLLMNFPRGVLYGCGDLIFSSHMIFSLVFVRTFYKYGTHRFLKFFAWLLVVLQSFLIVASRKHYTVDVVVAWYTVNLVVFFVDKKLPELPDRSNGAATQLLPLSKDNKTKEETHKLLNANSGDSTDWRPRNQFNGKIMEQGNVEASVNGV